MTWHGVFLAHAAWHSRLRHGIRRLTGMGRQPLGPCLLAAVHAAPVESELQSIFDKCETMLALTDGMATVAALKERIVALFDDNRKGGVILSSVHRAKGDEAQHVWILKPELMPHPLASQPWQIKQEQNLMYVAYTRSKHTLTFVDGD